MAEQIMDMAQGLLVSGTFAIIAWAAAMVWGIATGKM